jgi:hypothetical protein
MDGDPVVRAWSGVENAIVHPATRKIRRIGYRRRAVEKPVGPEAHRSPCRTNPWRA